MEEIERQIVDTIENSEMVLVGIGDELSEQPVYYEDEDIYTGFLRSLKSSPEKKWMDPFVREYCVRNTGAAAAVKEAYGRLAELLSEKNYFIVSVNQDGLIDRTALEPKRIVTPCGNRRLLQCMEGCCSTLWDADGEIIRIAGAAEAGDDLDTCEAPVCPSCGGRAVFNRISDAGRYREEGYLDQWRRYTDWLRRTLNHRITVLELGAGMEYPSIIRWAFEKVAFLNKKASFVRVHSRLPQLSEELAGKGLSVRRNPLELLGGLGQAAK